MSLSCRTYDIVPTDCPCILQLVDSTGNILALNLDGATVRPILGGTSFHIQTSSGGAKVDGDTSSFTLEDIEDLICQCHAAAGTEVLYRCLCDDTLSDGTNIVPFVEAFTLETDGVTITRTVLGTFTDVTFATPYTTLGTVSPCSEAGSVPIGESAEYLYIDTAGTWVMPSTDVTEVTITVLTATGSSPNLTTDSGTSYLPVGTYTWRSTGVGSGMLLNTLEVVTTANDVVTIDYTTMTY